jgi:hypothetical protein
MMRNTCLMVIAVLFTLALCVPAHADIINGLVAHYKLDGNGKDVLNRNNGTVYGATSATDRIGNADSAMNFDGVDDYIEVANPTNDLNIGSQSWTMSAWFRSEDSGTGGTIVSRRESTAYYLTAGSPAGVPRHVSSWFWDDSGTLNHISDRFPSMWRGRDWHHGVVVLSRDPADLPVRIYIDGIDHAVSWDSIGTINTTNSPFSIGYILTTSGGISYFIGDIDDIRIYNRALTRDDVRELYYWRDQPPALLKGQNVCSAPFLSGFYGAWGWACMRGF